MSFPAADWVQHHARVKPGAEALASVDSGELRTWGELEERVGRLAHGLTHALGLTAGDRIATLMNSDIRSFELQFACMRAGLILAPLNYRLAVPELVLLCKEIEPALIVTDDEWMSTADLLVEQAGIPKRLTTSIGGGSELDALIETSSHMKASGAVDPNATIYILFTSGTTGLPKGAMSTHSTLIWQAINQVQLSRVALEGAHMLAPTPLFHAGGLNPLCNPILFFGGKVSIASRFVPGDVLKFLGNPANAVTHISLGAVMYQFLAETPEFEDTDFSCIKLALVAGGRLSERLCDTYLAKGVKFNVQFGGTETGPTISSLDSNLVDKVRAGSCGQPVMNVQIRVVDETGRDVPVGQPGEIWVKGPAITVGYWRKDPEVAFNDGWFRTGDVVKQDEDGFLYVVDRIKDMFKSGGENVSSLEVETVLLMNPAIAECAVIGVPHAKWGEVGLAVIRPAPGHEISLELVQEICAPHLARYKHPKSVALVDHFPRNVTGKISKADLRKQFGGSATA